MMILTKEGESFMERVRTVIDNAKNDKEGIKAVGDLMRTATSEEAIGMLTTVLDIVLGDLVQLKRAADISELGIKMALAQGSLNAIKMEILVADEAPDSLFDLLETAQKNYKTASTDMMTAVMGKEDMEKMKAAVRKLSEETRGAGKSLFEDDDDVEVDEASSKAQGTILDFLKNTKTDFSA